MCKVASTNPISKVSCDSTGLLMGVGDGSILNVMDVRFDRKLFSIKSSYNEPINSIYFMKNIRCK